MECLSSSSSSEEFMLTSSSENEAMVTSTDEEGFMLPSDGEAEEADYHVFEYGPGADFVQCHDDDDNHAYTASLDSSVVEDDAVTTDDLSEYNGERLMSEPFFSGMLF